MVEAGQIVITGSLNDMGISQGFNRIIIDFNKLENQANQTNASFNKMSTLAKSIATTFIALGGTALGSMTALATKSPVLAGTFARMEVETLKLSNTLGRQLQPAFEGVVNFIQNFNKALIDNPDLLSNMASKTGEALSDIGNAIAGEWNNISNIIPKSTGVMAGIAMGKKFGLKGMLLGAALGYIAGDLMTSDVSPENERFGVFGESMTSADKTGTAIGEWGSSFWNLYTQPSNIGENYPAYVKSSVNMLGSGFQTGTNAIWDTLEWLFSKFSNKDKELTTSNGVTR